MTEQELKECISEVKYSDIPKPAKKKIMNVLYEKLHSTGGYFGCREECMMSEEEKIKFVELLKTMPKKHPFEPAELCELYCYDDTPTYVTRPAYDAFTYPTYDRDSQSFFYRHYDMEAETSDDVRVDLIELLEASIDNDFVKAIKICNMFNVPMSDIKACQEKILKERERYAE